MTPDQALAELKSGNRRYIDQQQFDRDYEQEIRATATGQEPIAAVLSCIDSRVPAEAIFDQGLGKLFVARVAGNVVNQDIVGSLEFASCISTAKLIVVLGHTGCGAVKGACTGEPFGSLTAIFEKIQPAIDAVSARANKDDAGFPDLVAVENVRLACDAIVSCSDSIQQGRDAGQIKIVGAVYDIGTGSVRFLDS